MAVYKDKERGTYYFIIRVKQLDGSVKQVKKRGFPTKKAAKIAEAEAMIARPSQKGIPFSTLAEEYMDWYSSRRKDSSTTKVKSIIDIYLLPEFGNEAIDEIRPKAIMNFHTKLIKENFSGNHIKNVNARLSAIFNFAIKREQLATNPAKIAGNIEVESNKAISYWSLDEFKQFMDHVDDFRYYVLFMVLYYSGFRRGELLALTWSDIDFENNMINVNKTRTGKSVSSPKTSSSVRKILMPSHTMDLLQQLKRKVDPKPSYCVFGSYHSCISTTILYDYFYKYVKASGVKKIKIHDFRHSHASYLINKNIIVSVVAKRLGHSNVATTLNTYSHLYPSTEKDAVLSMEDDFKTAQKLKLLP